MLEIILLREKKKITGSDYREMSGRTWPWAVLFKIMNWYDIFYNRPILTIILYICTSLINRVMINILALKLVQWERWSHAANALLHMNTQGKTHIVINQKSRSQNLWSSNPSSLELHMENSSSSSEVPLANQPDIRWSAAQWQHKVSVKNASRFSTRRNNFHPANKEWAA